MDVYILTLNVAGLNNLVRCNSIKVMLKKLDISLVCLQETHLKKNEERYLRQIFKGHIYHATSGAHTKGIMIGTGKKVGWKPKDVWTDDSGHYLILCGWLNLQPIPLVGIFAPNNHQNKFGRVTQSNTNLQRLYIDTSHNAGGL